MHIKFNVWQILKQKIDNPIRFLDAQFLVLMKRTFHNGITNNRDWLIYFMSEGVGQFQHASDWYLFYITDRKIVLYINTCVNHEQTVLTTLLYICNLAYMTNKTRTYLASLIFSKLLSEIYVYKSFVGMC